MSDAQIKEIGEKYDIELVLLFGSRADGSFRKDSDFDIAYKAERPLNSYEKDQLFILLMRHLGSDNLHIVDMRDVKPLFLYEIMNNCKVLYAKNMMDFYELRVYALRRFEDEVKPLYNIIFERLKNEYSI
jgi:predicted nucleotidyltransferase